MIRKVIDRILGVVLSSLMAILVLDVLYQVGSRYITNTPSSFTDELAGYLLIWVGLLGAAYVCGKQEHLAIDILLQKVRPALKNNLQLLIYTLTMLFALLVMVVGGSWLVYTRFLLEVTSASLEINLGYVYLVLPLSGILIVYYSIDNAIQYRRAYLSRKDSFTH